MRRLVDEKQHAIGLIFGGMSDAPETIHALPDRAALPVINRPQRIEGYGVANPITDVMDRLKIELMV
ncbi:MAG TPA: hypothetical protein VFY67_05180 [Pyrinomonadaceae bacterium]|nr:hypothetical protein [Pyrinomonadaceae bacterium]